MLTAERPTDSMGRKLDARPLIAPRKIVSSISPEVEIAILKGLELEAKDRPQKIKEWLSFCLVSSQGFSEPKVQDQQSSQQQQSPFESIFDSVFSEPKIQDQQPFQQQETVSLPWGWMSWCFCAYCILSMGLDNTRGGIFTALILVLAGALPTDLPKPLAGALAGTWALALLAGAIAKTEIWALPEAPAEIFAWALAGVGFFAGAWAWAEANFDWFEALVWVVFFGVIGAIAGGILVNGLWIDADSIWIGALVGSGVSNFVWSALIAQVEIKSLLRGSLTQLQIFEISTLTATSGIGCGWLVRVLFFA